MASPCKTADEKQVSSQGLMLDTPRQRVPGHPLHVGPLDTSPALPPNPKVPTNSPILMQEQPQHEWPDTQKVSAVSGQHDGCCFSKTSNSPQTSAEGTATGHRHKRAATAVPWCQSLLASEMFWSLTSAAIAMLFFIGLASMAGNSVTEMDHKTSCTARHAMSLSNPEDMCVVGFKSSDPTACQSSTLLFCQIEWFDKLTVQETNQLHQEGWLVLIDSGTNYSVPTAWYVCTNFLSPNISDVLGGDDLTKWGPWAGQAHKEIDHWNAALVHEFTVDSHPRAMARALTELFARALHACGAIQYYYTGQDILGLTAGNDTLSTPRFKPTIGCDMGAESVVQGMTESFRNLISDSQNGSFAIHWTRQELDCLNFTYERISYLTQPAGSNLHYDDKSSYMTLIIKALLRGGLLVRKTSCGLNVTQNSSTSQCLANSKWSEYLAPPFVTNISHGRNKSVWLMPSAFKPYLCSGGVDIEAADTFSSFLLAAQQQLLDGHSFFKINVNSYNDLYAVFTATLGCVFGACVALIVIAIVGIARGLAKCCGFQVPIA